MNIQVIITSDDVRRLIRNYILATLPNNPIDLEDIAIKVKSKQNYREQTWELGDIQVTIDVNQE